MAKQQKLIEWSVYVKFDGVVTAVDTFQAPVPLHCNAIDRVPHRNACEIIYGQCYAIQPSSQPAPL